MDNFKTRLNTRVVNKQAPKIAWGLAIACLILILLYIIWTQWQRIQTKKSNYQPQQTQVINNAGPSFQINELTSANLFGDLKESKPVVKQAPKTTLDLKLQGLLWASNTKLARAIIAAGNKKAELYSVGELIKGADASVKEIRDNEVILSRSGALESLPLIKKTSSGNRSIIAFEQPIDPVAESFQYIPKPQPSIDQVDRRKSTPEQRKEARDKRLNDALKKMGNL